MSFWDLAQTAATIAAGVYGGPIAGAAVGGGLSAVRGKDVIMGTVSGAMAGYGGQGMDAAASQTALKSGTTNAVINQGMNQGITAGTNLTTPTMTGFGGSAGGSGINTLPTPTMPSGNFGNVRNIDTTIGGGNLTGPGGNFASPSVPIKTPIPQNLQGGANPNANFGSVQGTNFNNAPDYSADTAFKQRGNTNYNPNLQNTEVGANLNNPNTNISSTDKYNFVDQTSVRVPTFSEKFSAVSNNPREFMKNLGGGNEMYGAGKLGLTGLGLYASAIEPEDPYGDYKMPGNETRNRGPQGQLNLSGESSLNLNNPYGYAKGGGVTQGKSLNVNNIKPLNVNTGSNTPPPPPSAARAVPASGVNVGGGSGVGGIFKPFSVDTQFVMGHGTMPADAVMQGPAQNYTQDIAGNYIRKAQGGIINGYAEGGYLSGGNVPGDGMSDSIPAMIGRGQQAALSEGEFVVPADVVSHLGNGSSNAGSKQLYAMMDQVRKDRTGTEKQGKQINAERYMPA